MVTSWYYQYAGQTIAAGAELTESKAVEALKNSCPWVDHPDTKLIIRHDGSWRTLQYYHRRDADTPAAVVTSKPGRL